MRRDIPSKEFVLSEIRRISESLGRVPGKQIFEEESGLSSRSFLGRYWVNWTDAVAEAGLTPNQLVQAYPKEQLLQLLAELVRELHHIPTINELRFAWRNKAGFPHPDAFNRRLGPKQDWSIAIRRVADQNTEFADILPMIPESVAHVPLAPSKETRSVELGIVYLFKERRYYKIGRSNSLGRREYELGILLPEKLKLIHQIRTDDPVGIETYWHNRFKDKRKEGEWFDLDADDIAAFKRRKHFM
jgi:hypothetical protein